MDETTPDPISPHEQMRTFDQWRAQPESCYKIGASVELIDNKDHAIFCLFSTGAVN
ncbi:hypothetical protein [Novosphingobium sp. 9]|uniref:hypothetical protein n=1 Tax=Novosphingobium sp. 9 TaxID=2025349 RepID=UPI0021B5176F|nr:hypothetical protein [Novosphingobium sp. 9]